MIDHEKPIENTDFIEYSWGYTIGFLFHEQLESAKMIKNLVAFCDGDVMEISGVPWTVVTLPSGNST